MEGLWQCEGDHDVKFYDVVGGGEGMTIMVLLSSPPENSIFPPMLIFQNRNSSYPIRGIAHKKQVYRIELVQTPGWIAFFGAAIGTTCPSSIAGRKERVTVMDNASDHALTEDVRKDLEISMQIFVFHQRMRQTYVSPQSAD